MGKKPRKQLEPHQQEDAARLRRLWDHRKEPRQSQLDFALNTGIGQTQGSVEQYLNGRIPLNLPVAIKFAKGLDCTVADISPNLAAQLGELGNTTPTPHAAQKPLQLYSLDPDNQTKLLSLFDQLTPPQQEEFMQQIEAAVTGNIETHKYMEGRKLIGVRNERTAKLPAAPPYALPTQPKKKKAGISKK